MSSRAATCQILQLMEGARFDLMILGIFTSPVFTLLR